MSGYLIYHPRRRRSTFDNINVFHDSTGGNQDPYVWNERFLHTFCHITQMSPREGDINFWVSGDTFPDFSLLHCDLVFVVDQKIYWSERNSIAADDPLIDSPEAFNDHYQWAQHQHHFKRRRRFTLKADPNLSFQPQDPKYRLIDIVKFLTPNYYTLETLRTGLRAGIGSTPFRLTPDAVSSMYLWVNQQAPIKLKGDMLSMIRKKNSSLASQMPSRKR